jgi:hypothetical protein
MTKEKKKIPLKKYDKILNRWGLPVTTRWLEILVKREKEGGDKAPFEWVQETGNTYVIID